MSEQILPLADAYPEVTRDDWLRAVDKILKGRSIDRIRTTLDDGIVVEPLHTRDDVGAVGALPGQGDLRRATRPEGSTGGWDIRQRHVVGADASRDAEQNAAMLEDLQRGVMSLELDLRGPVDAERLDALLAEVLIDLAPISLTHPDDGLAGARAFLEMVGRRELPTSGLQASLGCDPIGRLADRGGVGRPSEAAITEVAAFAVEVAATAQSIRTVRVDGSPYAEGGASPALELGVIVATGVAWLRSLTDAGLSVGDAADQLELVVTVGTDQFGDIAKLRALRVVWARVAAVAGAAGHVPAIAATTTESVLTEVDPWVNMLRTTVACFAAAVAGADSIVVAPFDAAAGVPDELGRRIARNTQLILTEESNLHRVIDPAGGSYAIESLTDALADAAWHHFQAIEAAGGIVAALRAGLVQDEIDATAAAHASAVATRRAPITGVSEFPELGQDPLVREPFASRPAPLPDPEARPIPRRRRAAPYEALRAAAAAATERPTVFLANLGPVAQHTARASWATNAFAAGGIEAVGNDGFATADEVAAAFTASGCRIAVLCSSDAIYTELAVPTVQALRATGAERVYLAGDPGDRREAETAAGVDEFVHVGVDLIAVLTAAHEALGVEPIASTETVAAAGGAA